MQVPWPCLGYAVTLTGVWGMQLPCPVSGVCRYLDRCQGYAASLIGVWSTQVPRPVSGVRQYCDQCPGDASITGIRIVVASSAFYHWGTPVIHLGSPVGLPVWEKNLATPSSVSDLDFKYGRLSHRAIFTLLDTRVQAKNLPVTHPWERWVKHSVGQPLHHRQLFYHGDTRKRWFLCHHTSDFSHF